jgi:hypothetical protein
MHFVEVSMLSSVKRILIILAILTVVVTGSVLIYSSGRTYYNNDDEIGNTTGNIINGGLFCENEGKIYFSNDMADGSLYVMNSDCSNIKKVSNDKAVYINVDENYIYYVRANNTRENQSGNFLMFYNTGVFRINQNGSNLKAITGNPGAYLTLKGNNIYFQRYDVGVGLYLYKYQIDGSLERLLLKDAVIPSTIKDTSLYYVGYAKDHNINSLDLESFTTHPVFTGSYAYPIFMGDYIYYMNPEEDYRIYRMNSDGSNPTLLVDERCSTYNVTNTGDYLYYQVDDTKNNRISRINLETLDAETLLDGNYKQIHVTDSYVFFKDFDNTNTYIMPANGAPDVSIFSPLNPDSKQ